MPEGHTLHRLARLHTEYFAGGPVRVSSPQGRFADHVSVDGRYFDRATAVGKHLFHHYEGGLAVHVHLGLYGFFDTHLVPEGQDPPAPVGQVRMRVGTTAGDGPAHVVDLRGPTRCEVIAEAGVADVRDRLGPDPLDPAADPDRAWARISRSARTIGALLMDQKVLAGVGNVYRAEVLFRHGISPFLPGVELRAGEFRALWDDLVTLMEVGVETGAIHTIRPEHDHGDVPRRGADRPRNYVYQRDGWACRVCGDEIALQTMDARTLFWCPTCQAGRPR
ncbi:endonuclease-8 [Dietzia kunjamensis subsp. schimae]|uniref:DNA-(apurinic or apyrimidinic site) lyase n=1 Tax=Dietzia kunjamensis subsp. schimae TaxID=498198 RepID=A0ABY1N2P5_9ACTN|nr:DNA-formamidopyrimidine glycosylase family protein [Dietzia kunjamensis]MBB1016160.1 Fpg/Nei family DNA glycosylase [Dietzia kunjamensis subsp. schimae]SMO79594.1 endonuclease-8 [Dietzia kunjamensis subsp. schimae]